MQNNINNIGNTVSNSFQDLWFRFVNFIPNLISAIIVFIIGLVIAIIVGKLIKNLIRMTGIDHHFGKTRLKSRLGIKMGISNIVGWFAKWFIIIATLIAVSNILGLPQVNDFLNRILLYIPNVIVAVIILVIGVVAAEFLSDLISGALQASEMDNKFKIMIPEISKYALIIFAGMAALEQLGIVPELIQIMLAGIVLTLALSIGLGSKDHVFRWIDEFRTGSRNL